MKYISTRGGITPCSFDETLLLSLASDGGLFYPESIPKLNSQTLDEWSSLSYEDLCTEILHLFIGDECISKGDLSQIISKSFCSFDCDERVPIKKINSYYIAEFHHGPSLSNNDFPMQFLGNYLEYYVNRHLKQNSKQPKIITVVIGSQSTSGPACLEALKSKNELISCFALYSSSDVRRVAEKEMSRVMGTSIHCIHVNNSCTCEILNEIVNMINNKKFNNYQYIVSANALNWFRVLLEIPFYFYTYFQVSKQTKADISISTASCNITSMMAGIYAHDMDVPFKDLLISCVEPDPLGEFMKTGIFRFKQYKTNFPANDGIVHGNCQFNIERLLYYLYQDTNEVNRIINMTNQKDIYHYEANIKLIKKKLSYIYLSEVVSSTCEELCRHLLSEELYFCPYTLCSLYNTEQYQKKHSKTIVITFSISHPGKYPYFLAKEMHTTPGTIIPEYMTSLNQYSTRKSSIDIHKITLEQFIFSQAWDSMKQYIH